MTDHRLAGADLRRARGRTRGTPGSSSTASGCPALFHFALGPSVIHPYFFEDLISIPGGYPARFGRFAAGIVAARTRAAPDDDRATRRSTSGCSTPGRWCPRRCPAAAPSRSPAATRTPPSWCRSLNQRRPPRVLGLPAARRPARRAGRAHAAGFRLARRARPPEHAARDIVARFPPGEPARRRCRCGGRSAAAVALGSDHTRCRSSTSTRSSDRRVHRRAPRLAYLRPSRPPTSRSASTASSARYQPVTIGALHRAERLDLGKRRDGTLLAGYASLDAAGGRRLVVTPELRFDSYQVAAPARRPGPAAQRAGRAQRRHGAPGGGRPLHPAAQPPPADPGRATPSACSCSGCRAPGRRRSASRPAHSAGFELHRHRLRAAHVLTDVRDPHPVAVADPLRRRLPRQARRRVVRPSSCSPAGR